MLSSCTPINPFLVWCFFSQRHTPAHCCLLWQKNRKPSRCGERHAHSVTSWRLDCHLCVSFLLMSESFPGIRGICLQMQLFCHDIYDIANKISCILFSGEIYQCVALPFPLSSSIMSAICKSLLSRPFLLLRLTDSSYPFISRLSQSMMSVGGTQLMVCNFQPLFAYGYPVLSSISPFVLNEPPKGSGWCPHSVPMA